MPARVRIGPFTRDLLEALQPLLNVSFGDIVSIDDERDWFELHQPQHWLVAWDAGDRPVGFVRDHPGALPGGRARGEAHAVDGPERLPVLRELLEAFLARRPPSPLRFVVAGDDPFAQVLRDLGFAGERRLRYELRLGAIPGSVGVRQAEPRDAEAVHRLLGDVPEDGLVLVTVGRVQGALRLALGEHEDAAVVEAIAVEEEARRQGIAQRLLRAACERTTARGWSRLVLWVPEGNRAARALFEGFGFQRRPALDLLWLDLEEPGYQSVGA